ncbi:genetransfer agent terminase protein [alpha proteobacterium U9-1i]|nr:genetransfer agent terminase protein [alpha proteobacterium U9-1i]
MRWRAVLDDFAVWGRLEQLPPSGDWRTWMFLGGRGAGKTRAGAEWVSHRARNGLSRRIALIGPTFHDVREVMVEWGLLALPHERPRFEISRRRLVWSNGAEAGCFSAEDPESLRGPQFDAAWCDELAYWTRPDATLGTLAHALRLGRQPLLMVTTTPKPLPVLKQLARAKDTVVTTASTWANAPNLAPGFVAAMNERWSGSARDRQELLGELVEDFSGALWTRAQLEAARDSRPREFDRIVVAVDPPVSVGENADACGIIAAGRYEHDKEYRAIVLADATVQGLEPMAWARRAAELADALGADCILAEGNNGGELVRTMLSMAAPHIPVRLAHARHNKRQRAEPVSGLYTKGLVAHKQALPNLEDEMCGFGGEGFSRSPDRLDALVWALSDLLLSGGEPRVRAI